MLVVMIHSLKSDTKLSTTALTYRSFPADEFSQAKDSTKHGFIKKMGMERVAGKS